MELIWLVLGLLAFDLAVLLFAVDTRPGFEHSSRPRPLRSGTRRFGTRRFGTLPSGTGRPQTRRFIGG
jgi:hypothetical protein